MNINSSYFQSNDLLASNPFQSEPRGPDNIRGDISSGNHRIESRNIGVLYNKIPNEQRKTQKHVVVVDTSTRMFEKESMWDFRIKFNPSFSEVRKQAKYNNGLFEYDSVFFSGERGCHIRNTYKNIIEFDIVTVEIPMRILDFIGSSLYTLFILIPELSGFNGIKTNKDESYSFILKGNVHSHLSLTYKSFSPINFPIPTNQLSTMNLKTHIPPYSSIENIESIGKIDIFLLSEIIFDPDDNTLELLCDESIPSLFTINDALSFDNVSFSSPKLKNFFEGKLHRIIKINDSNNGIFIKATNLDSGDFDSNNKIQPAETRIIQGKNVSALEPFVVNMNLQIQYTLILTTTQSVD